MERRLFLRLGSMSLVIAGVDPSFARSRFSSGRASSHKTLVYVFQRFGADGLNTVVPVEAAEYALYRSYRPNLAVDRTHPDVGPLDGDFAFHPLLKNGLHRLWLDGQVAVLPNVGYPEGSRSHFDSQLFLELGTPHVKTTGDGWLNRYLASAPPSVDPLRAVALGPVLPESMRGPAPVLAFRDIEDLSVTRLDPVRNQKFFDLQAVAYGEQASPRRYNAAIRQTGKTLIDAVRSIPTPLPAPGPGYPAGAFGKALLQLAQLIRSDLFEIELAHVELGGWDTHGHQQQTMFSGVFPSLLSQFSNGITAFVDDLGPQRMANTMIVTTSEFGRTARENGSYGTDHGSGWASFVIGGGVRGGVYFGADGWHGLSDLRDDRDLKHSLDFRDVLAEVLLRHMGRLDPGVFPGWTPTPVGFL